MEEEEIIKYYKESNTVMDTSVFTSKVSIYHTISITENISTTTTIHNHSK